MTHDKIEKFIEDRHRKDNPLNIHFKDRQTLTGLFIRGNDYNELKSKNFWRIVTYTHFEEWKRTRNHNLARIFNGLSFTKLSECN